MDHGIKCLNLGRGSLLALISIFAAIVLSGCVTKDPYSEADHHCDSIEGSSNIGAYCSPPIGQLAKAEVYYSTNCDGGDRIGDFCAPPIHSRRLADRASPLDQVAILYGGYQGTLKQRSYMNARKAEIMLKGRKGPFNSAEISADFLKLLREGHFDLLMAPKEDDDRFLIGCMKFFGDVKHKVRKNGSVKHDAYSELSNRDTYLDSDTYKVCRIRDLRFSDRAREIR